jgi:hypothetical protein
VDFEETLETTHVEKQGTERTMDSIRTRIDILPGDSEAAPDHSPVRARLPRTLLRKLLDSSTPSNGLETADDVTEKSALQGLAVCVEFEKTVEDSELWVSSFGNGRTEETLEERRRRDGEESRRRGKDVLLIWSEVTVSLGFPFR